MSDINSLPGLAGPAGVVPRSPDDLALQLIAKIEKDDDLAPLRPLLDTCLDPDADRTPETHNALLKIKNFVEGKKPPMKAKLPVIQPSSEVHEEDGTGVLFTTENRFGNWGETVSNKPAYMFLPKSLEGVKNLVKWATKKGKRVRVAGFRHTWSDLYGGDGDILVSLLPLETTTVLPYREPPQDSWYWKSQLQGITPVESVAGRSPPPGHGFVNIMAGTTNDQLRTWCFEHKTLCLPFNVIMVEVTFGGTNAPICHGSGLSSSTLSDIVEALTYVDVHGELQTISDPQELRTASGCFGLLGIVVSLTLRLDQMSVAQLQPVKLPLPLAIPPPKGYPIPKQVQSELENLGITDAQLEQARQDFERRCDEDYYVEWFWFPYQRHCWVNTWQKRPMTSNDMNLQAYPGTGILNGAKGQWNQARIAEDIESFAAWKLFPAHLQAYTFGVASMAALPNISDPKDRIQTYVSEALHFRRGIQNFRVWDAEWEIPIPSSGGKRDYQTVQRAWWDGISAMYSQDDEAPVRVALEMRLTGSSNVLLAPQRGNGFGTASIEVLTTTATPQKLWTSFRQDITDLWTSYKDEKGQPLNVRPHWAKQWDQTTVRGKPIERYLKEDAYPTAFSEFRKGLEDILTKRGATVNETRERFGNALLDRLIFD